MYRQRFDGCRGFVSPSRECHRYRTVGESLCNYPRKLGESSRRVSNIPNTAGKRDGEIGGSSRRAVRSHLLRSALRQRLVRTCVKRDRQPRNASTKRRNRDRTQPGAIDTTDFRPRNLPPKSIRQYSINLLYSQLLTGSNRSSLRSNPVRSESYRSYDRPGIKIFSWIQYKFFLGS